MEIQELVSQISLLENDVQRRTHTYIMEREFTNIIDNQLNGHLRALLTYCRVNNLTYFAEEINGLLPIEQNAIEFFCFWDGIVEDILESSNILSGIKRVNLIEKIACMLQQSMTKNNIDAYFKTFGINTNEDGVVSKRVYVETLLKEVDSLVIIRIAKDLGLYSADLVETSIENKLSKEFALQQVSKCRSKMNANDYDGAITNARTLIEEVLLEIEERLNGNRSNYDGKLESLYKRVAKQINMYPDDSSIENNINQILRGFISITSGFAGISNNIADRHATTKHPNYHHAKFVVNSAFVLCEFLLDSYEYQHK